MGFRLGPNTPSRAKVLRAELAVIARRAYEVVHHNKERVEIAPRAARFITELVGRVPARKGEADPHR